MGMLRPVHERIQRRGGRASPSLHKHARWLIGDLARTTVNAAPDRDRLAQQPSRLPRDPEVVVLVVLEEDVLEVLEVRGVRLRRRSMFTRATTGDGRPFGPGSVVSFSRALTAD